MRTFGSAKRTSITLSRNGARNVSLRKSDKQDSQLAADIAGIQRRIGPPMQEAAA